MDCRQAQDILLRSDDPRKGTGEAAGYKTHLKSCSACASLAKNVLLLERSWRQIPLPEEAAQSQERFLRKIKKPAPLRTVPQKRSDHRSYAEPAPARRGWFNWRWAAPAVAAAIAAMAIGFYLFLAPGEAQASSADVLEDLVEWNVQLAQADALPDRAKIYEEKAAEFRLVLSKAELTADEREIADLLLANAGWLAAHDDPIAEADRFDEIADKLAEQAKAADAKENTKSVARFTGFCGRITEHGILNNWEKAETKFGFFTKGFKFDGKSDKGPRPDYERMMAAFKSRMEAMSRFADKMPPTWKKDSRGFDFSKHSKGPFFGKFPKGKGGK